MIKKLAIASALVATLAAAPFTNGARGQGESKGQGESETPGNPPQILIASSIDKNGNLDVVSFKTIYIGFDGYSYNNKTVNKQTLRDVKIQTLAGAKISVDEARELLAGKETPILATSHDEPLSKFYQQLFAAKSLVFIFPDEAPLWKEIGEPDRPLR